MAPIIIMIYSPATDAMHGRLETAVHGVRANRKVYVVILGSYAVMDSNRNGPERRSG